MNEYRSAFSHEDGFETHGSKTLYLAINIMISAGKFDVLHFCAGLNGFEAPLTGKSLMITTVSPSCSTVPFASFMTDVSVSSITTSMSSLGFHSWPHSGHIIELPVGYPYNDWQLGHLLESGIY
jgi:hypothetical protein